MEHRENYCLAVVTVSIDNESQEFPFYTESGCYNELIKEFVNDGAQVQKVRPSMFVQSSLPKRLGYFINAAFMFDGATEGADHKKRFENFVDECDALATILDWYDVAHGSRKTARVEDVEALARLENLLNYIPDLQTLVSVVNESNPDMWLKTVDKRFEDWDEPAPENNCVEWDVENVSYRLYWA